MAAKAKVAIEITADDRASGVLGKLGKNLEGFSSGFRKVGLASAAASAAIIGGLTISLKQFAQTGEELANMSARTGIAADKLAGLKYAAVMADVGMEVLEVGIRTMQKNLVDAGDMISKNMAKAQTTFAGAMKGQEDAFTKLGLSISKLRGMSPDQQFMAIAEALAKIPDPTLKSALAMEIFGRSGTQMISLLNILATEGLEAFIKKAREMGLVLDAEGILKAQKLADAWKNVELSLQGLKLAIGEVLAPALTKLLTDLTEVLGKAVAWAKANPELAETLIMLGVKAAIVLGIIGGIGLVMPSIITGIKLLAVVIGGVVAAFSGWGLIAAAVFVAITVGLYLLWKHWDTVFGWIGESINRVIALLNKLPLVNIGKLTSIAGVPTGKPMTGTPAYVPGFQWGGTVPGMRGQPQLIMAHGGEVLSGMDREAGGGSVVVNVGGSVIAEHNLLDIIRQQLILVKNRNYTTGIA